MMLSRRLAAEELLLQARRLSHQFASPSVALQHKQSISTDSNVAAAVAVENLRERLKSGESFPLLRGGRSCLSENCIWLFDCLVPYAVNRQPSLIFLDAEAGSTVGNALTSSVRRS